MSLKRAFGLAAVAAAFLVCAPKADAQTAPVTGTVSKGGDEVGTFTGQFDLDHFVVKKGELFAVGTLTGEIEQTGKKAKQVKNRRVTLPVDLDASNISNADVAAMADGDVEASALEVPVLHLVLGPLDLNLLGLHVHLNQVVLDITADPTGGLLGSLLAFLAGLDLSSLTGLLALLGDIGDLADLLNMLISLLG
jgi:autotransporter translocation and assembly factor TamB